MTKGLVLTGPEAEVRGFGCPWAENHIRENLRRGLVVRILRLTCFRQ